MLTVQGPALCIPPSVQLNSQGTCSQRGSNITECLTTNEIRTCHKWGYIQCPLTDPPEEISDPPDRNFVLLYSSAAFARTSAMSHTFLCHFHYGKAQRGPTPQCLALLVFFQSACSLQPSETPCSKMAFTKAIHNKIQDLHNWPFLEALNGWHFFSLKLFPPLALMQWVSLVHSHHSDHPFPVPVVEVPGCCHLLISYCSSSGKSKLPPLLSTTHRLLTLMISPGGRSFSWAPNYLSNTWSSTALQTPQTPNRAILPLKWLPHLCFSSVNNIITGSFWISPSVLRHCPKD